MREDNHVESEDQVLWTRSSGAGRIGDASSQGKWQRILPPVVVDINDAMVEARDGLYGITVVQARGEHHSGLSIEQAVEFRHRLVSLVEECFAPDQGDRTGIKHGFNWALTPIGLHPLTIMDGNTWWTIGL